MLLMYVDDSSSHAGEKPLFLAGYVLPVSTWQSFNADWRLALQQGKRLSSLHMTRSFDGWSQAERLEKLSQLVDVIERYRPVSIEVSMSTRDFKELVVPSSPHDLRHPYFVCFHALMVTTARALRELKMPGPVDFVFDNQGNVGTEAAIWYEPIRQLQAEPIREMMGGTPVFRDDDDEPGLQAADLLVWFRRLLSEPTCTDEQREFAGQIVFTHCVAELPRSMLEQWAEHHKNVPGIEAVKGKRGSVNKIVKSILESTPRDRVLRTLDALERRGRRYYRLKMFLERIGLSKLAGKLGKRVTPIK